MHANTDLATLLGPSAPTVWTFQTAKSWVRDQEILTDDKQQNRLITSLYEYRRDAADNLEVASDQIRKGALYQQGLRALVINNGWTPEVLMMALDVTQSAPQVYLRAVEDLPVDELVLQQELSRFKTRHLEMTNESHFIALLQKKAKHTLLASHNFQEYRRCFWNYWQSSNVLVNRERDLNTPREITNFVQELRQESLLADIRALSHARQKVYGELAAILQTHNVSPLMQQTEEM